MADRKNFHLPAPPEKNMFWRFRQDVLIPGWFRLELRRPRKWFFGSYEVLGQRLMPNPAMEPTEQILWAAQEVLEKLVGNNKKQTIHNRLKTYRGDYL